MLSAFLQVMISLSSDEVMLIASTFLESSPWLVGHHQPCSRVCRRGWVARAQRCLFTLRSIIIIIKRGWQCKAGRERLTPFQSEDPNPTTPTHRKKEEKGKTVGYKKWASSKANKNALALLLKPASPTPSNTGSLRSFHRDTEKGTKVRRYCEVLQRGGA